MVVSFGQDPTVARVIGVNERSKTIGKWKHNEGKGVTGAVLPSVWPSFIQCGWLWILYFMCMVLQGLPGWTLSPLCLWQLSFCKKWISLVKGLSCLVLSYLILSYLILSCLVCKLTWFGFTLSCLVVETCMTFFVSWPQKVVTSSSSFHLTVKRI